MGNEQSRSIQGEEAATVPSIQYLRNDEQRFEESLTTKKIKELTENAPEPNLVPEPLVKQAFEGVFSVQMPIGMGPSVRAGHFTVYSPETHQVFIGFGATPSGKLKRDIWSLDTTNFFWRRLRIVGDKIKRRSGCGACLMGGFIVVFGGFSTNEQYLNDLFTIDIESGYVQLAQTTGQVPSARSYPVIGVYNAKLFVWGGFNGSHPTDLSIMDFATMTWRSVETRTQGKTSAPYAIFDYRIYGYASGRTGGFTIIDMFNDKVTFEPVSGSPPPIDVAHPQMVKVGNYLFYFGGLLQKKSDYWTHLYACDVSQKNWWFGFYVRPDEVTAFSTEYRTAKGLFLLPRLCSFSCVYVPEKRIILAFLGHPMRKPPPLYTIDIGEALGFLNLREDMRVMFQYNPVVPPNSLSP